MDEIKLKPEFRLKKALQDFGVSENGQESPRPDKESQIIFLLKSIDAKLEKLVTRMNEDDEE